MASRVVAALALVALAVGCGGGKPRFQHAAGWHVLSSKSDLVAANVPLAAADRDLWPSPPSRTVASLRRSGIVIWAMYSRGGKSDQPRRSLPLRVEQAIASNPFEGFRCAPAVATASCYAASGSVWRLLGRYGPYDLDLFVYFGTDHPLPEDVAAADEELARLSLPRAPVAQATKAAPCPRPTGTGYYDTTVSPASGPVGTTVRVSGRLPVLSESGSYAGQTSTEITAYWNLDFDNWPSITSPQPDAAVAHRPVKLLGLENVAGRCTYRARLTIPAVRPGSYPIEVLFGDAAGGASFAPVDFRVTSG